LSRLEALKFKNPQVTVKYRIYFWVSMLEARKFKNPQVAVKYRIYFCVSMKPLTWKLTFLDLDCRALSKVFS